MRAVWKYNQINDYGHVDDDTPSFREYIYAATAAKYGDPLGPTYEQLRDKKTCRQIIESATRPIEDLNDRLTLEGFQTWYEQQEH